MSEVTAKEVRLTVLAARMMSTIRSLEQELFMRGLEVSNLILSELEIIDLAFNELVGEEN